MNFNDNFHNDFNKRSSFINKMFIGIFSLIVIITVVQISVAIWVGTEVVSEVQENNGSVAKTLGVFYKDFNEASK